MSGRLNYEMDDVSRLLLLSPTASNEYSSDSIITKSRSSSASSSTNSLSNSTNFFSSSNKTPNYKNYYSRNPNEIEIVNDGSKSNNNFALTKYDMNSSNKAINLASTKINNDKTLNCFILTPRKQDNNDEPVLVSSSFLNLKKSDKSSSNKITNFQASDSLSSTSFSPSNNLLFSQNKSFNASNSNINEINQLRTGALVKNLRKKFSPDENNIKTNNNKNISTRYYNCNTGLSYRSHQQITNYNNKTNPNKYDEQKKQAITNNNLEIEQTNQKQAQRSSSTNNLFFDNNLELNKRFKSEKNLFNNNNVNNLKRMNKTNSKSNNNLYDHDEIEEQNKKIDESNVFENVHIKDRINMFMSNTINNSNSSNTNLNFKPAAIKKQIADRAIYFGGSVNNLLSINTLPQQKNSDDNSSRSSKEGDLQNSKFNSNTDELSNDSANSTFSEDSSLLENNTSSKQTNENSHKGLDKNDTKNKMTSVLFESISFNTVKFEENYVKIKQAFNDLRDDNKLIESLLTDIRNKVKEAYVSIDWEAEDINDEQFMLTENDTENINNSHQNQTFNQFLSKENEDDVISTSKKSNINNENNDVLLSSHDNDDYFYYTAHSKKDMTTVDDSNLEDSLMTNNEDDLVVSNRGCEIRKSGSILSSLSSSSTNATISSALSSSSHKNDRVVLIRHKF